MVHGIISLKCSKGHTLPIMFDDNKCGCHHDGKPCIIVTCKECLDEILKNRDDDICVEDIVIPLDKEAMEVIEGLLKNPRKPMEYKNVVL